MGSNNKEAYEKNSDNEQLRMRVSGQSRTGEQTHAGEQMCVSGQPQADVRTCTGERPLAREEEQLQVRADVRACADVHVPACGQEKSQAHEQVHENEQPQKRKDGQAFAQKGEEVDLIGMAYQNARAEGVSLRTGGLGYSKVIAPAKVNLYLAVGAKQQNGYHTVQNVMHTLLVHDVLYMRCLSAEAFSYETGFAFTGENGNKKGLQIHLTCSGVGQVQPPEIPAEQNIVYKAIRAFAQAIDRHEDEVMDVHVEKHVPHQAGLGGGSSDAAAALVGAAKLWGISQTDERIEQVAKTLGADVVFFLRGGCALYGGAGENYVRNLQPRKDTVVLIKPEGGLSTAAVYSAFDENPSFATPSQEKTLASADAAVDVPLFNGLEFAAGHLDENLSAIRAWACAQPGVTQAMLTGSGSCTFTICENGAAARNVVAAAQAKGWWAASTYFANVRAAAGK